MTLIREERLANGLEVSFVDESNRYFGDYHRVCVRAAIRCDLTTLADKDLQHQATSLYGTSLVVEKRFERMGVASADVDQVRSDLVEDFMRHAATYLAHPEYPFRLVAAELKKRRPNRYYG
jgi:hypothetical protein